MSYGWVKSILSAFVPGGRSGEIGQGARAFERKAQANLLDLPDVIRLGEEERQRSMAFLRVLRKGGAKMDRFRFWLGVRRKVKRRLVEAYENIPDLTEEITEKIMEAAEHDPFLKRLFR